MDRNAFLTSADLIETRTISYVNGYKYQARNDMIYQTGVRPPDDIITPLIILRRDGWMRVSPYFAWDGCSWPALDTKSNMRAGHCHDAFYALMRMRHLPRSFRKGADAELRRLMIDDGACHFRAAYYEKGVNLCGERAATIERKVHTAP
jgi:hypothetical protein